VGLFQSITPAQVGPHQTVIPILPRPTGPTPPAGMADTHPSASITSAQKPPLSADPPSRHVGVQPSGGCGGVGVGGRAASEARPARHFRSPRSLPYQRCYHVSVYVAAVFRGNGGGPRPAGGLTSCVRPVRGRLLWICEAPTVGTGPSIGELAGDAQLLSIIDDHSRLIPRVSFYRDVGERSFQHCPRGCGWP
jgi:hypothetical protein